MILHIVYGYDIKPHGEDPLVKKVDEALQHFSVALVPGKWAVDMVPYLEYLPEWMPGAGFKRTARMWKQTHMAVVDTPYDFVRDRIARGQDDTSFVVKALELASEDKTISDENESAIKWSAASMYTAGADTSVSTAAAFFLAMSMYPDVQRKAQEEIDRVVGTTRLPTFHDRNQLPYINAVVEEAQRWHPVAPMGGVRMANENDVINEFRIPKGALVLPAIWWLTRDQAIYHEPEEFRPESFLEPRNEPSATAFTFGFGRRICTGKVLADASLYLTFVQTLAALNIQKAIDEHGHAVEPKHTFGAGILAHPGEFRVRVAPRSRHYMDMLERLEN